MVCGSKNKKRTRPARPRTLLLSALTAAALAAGCGISGVCPAARAAGYVFQQHTLNAGVLVTGTGPLGAGPQIDPAPYLFYVLNNRPDVRPVDLNLVNPLAPAGTLPSAAAYWEVSLNNVSDSQLAQYNVLYLPAGGVTFQPNVNEKLRRFVDNGGQLIIEYESLVPNPTPMPSGTPPVLGLLFTGTGASGTPASAALPSSGTFLRHPIISQPFLLSAADVANLTIQPAASSSAGYVNANNSDPVHKGEFGSLFSPVLSNSTGTLAYAAQMGAGQIVATTLSLGAGISIDANYPNPTTGSPTTAYTFNPVNFHAASTPDLKLLANILTWSETHPSENKTSHGNASSTGLASFSPAWQYGVATAGATPTGPPGAAVWGNFVFAVDAGGILRAFDAYPSENLTGGAGPAGAETATSLYPTTSYDEIWNTTRPQISLAGASVPTVASIKNMNYVFVEKRDGTIAAFNILDGTTPFTLTAPATGGTFPSTMNAPAPTIYDGRLYAGQTNGTIHVYDLNESTTGVVVTLNPSPPAGTTESVVAAPSVGTLADGNTNVLIAVVSTNFNVYTVLLGGRNEPLVPYPSFGLQQGYSISRQGRYDLLNIFADTGATAPALLAYDFNGTVLTSATLNTVTTGPQDPLFGTTVTGGYFTDWNMDFFNAGGGTLTPGTPGTPVNLNYISAGSFSQLNSPTPVAATSMSAPAIARNGDYYYTETQGTNSYLVGVRNNPLYSRVQLKFRFLIPGAIANGGTGLVDGDSVDYTRISGYQFVGAPVVDDQDNVYVAATGTVSNGAGVAGTTEATVLCFRGDQQVSASPYPANAAADLTSDSITQKDENAGADNNPFKGDGTFGQYTASPGSIQFYNFGKQGLTIRQIAGNVTEPQPLTATSTDAAATGTPLSMHTNLAWFVTPFAVTGTNSIKGLTQVGSSLLLTDGASLYRLSANPLVGAHRVVSTGPSSAPIGAGTVASAPSVGGSVLVINGTNGLAARTRQITVIADANRILGVDGDGNAVWAVDATTRTDATQTPPVSTKVGFSHPTALSQFAPNDYLVADPGSNRCVRFDSAGNVRWELTRFQDPNGLLGAGQPLTLSQPSSVVTRTAVVPAGAAQYVGDTATYYLVADSGNNRLVEVADFVSSAGVTDGNHVLTWASHTGDRYGRAYRYGSAAYYPNLANSPTFLSIAATVTNTRLAPLAVNAATNVVTGPGSVSGDSAGGSLVVFNYPANPQAYSAATPTNDLVYTTAGFYTASGTGSSATYTPFTIRSPRFLQLVSSATATAPTNPNPNNVPAFDFLYADDNGAFDLTYDANRKAFIAGPDRLQYTPSNYNNMTYQTTGASPMTLFVPALGVTDTVSSGTNMNNLRAKLPFIPTCVQALSSDSQAVSGSTQTTRRYLITQNYSQGELGNVNTTTTGMGAGAVTSAAGKLGGEVFEVDVVATTNGSNVVTAAAATTPGGFGVNETLSHPALTGPLTQPTYAVRLP